MKIKFDPRVFIRVKTQLVLMAITFVCMSFMIYQAIAGFNPAGKLPPANDYNNQKFFEKFHVNPARIKTGITLLNFLKFESEQNDFAFDAMMSFDYNPLEISPKIVDRFEFTRAKFLDKYIRDEVKKSPTHTRVEYYVRVQFSVDFFDHERFPFDDHILHINLINPGTDAKEVMYEMEPKKFILSSNLTVPGWDIICHQGRPAFRLHEDGDNVAEPILTFSLCLAKRDARHAALIFLPLFLIFFGGFFALSIKNPLTGLDMARASVVGLLAYDYIIINISPKTAFFMISDYLFLVFLIESFSIYLILFYCHYNVRQEYQEIVKGWASPIIILSLLCVWYYLVHFKGIYH